MKYPSTDTLLQRRPGHKLDAAFARHVAWPIVPGNEKAPGFHR